ncbi:MAG: 7-cyano-7-deazaguanine synthase, partial [Planctomycetaceae bacterium]|nr:7-cyano-7-deazaguanine synthase [Planctomycetaceae bacterium]
MKPFVILFGELDSTTLLYHYKAQGHQLTDLTCNYGRRNDGRMRVP